jgi:tetratricopeptide (TPR) repeat protein
MTSKIAFSIAILLTIVSIKPAYAESAAAVELNIEGVEIMGKIDHVDGYAADIKDDSWQTVFAKFEAALKLDPHYDLARRNLAIAHNNYGLYLVSQKEKWAEGLKQLHQAAYLDESNMAMQSSLADIIKKGFGMNPEDFEDRVKLGDQCRVKNDLAGAAVEYAAAIRIKDDSIVQRKRQEVEKLLGKEMLGRIVHNDQTSPKE